MKKKLFCFLMLLIPILSGCNYKELNNLSIVDVMGIDYINNNYVVTIKVISTNNNNNNEKNENLDENVYSASGKNISDAISNLNLVLPKKIYLNHLELLIISKNVATNKLNNITNYFINNNNVSKNFSVLLSLEDTSKVILEQKELLSSYSYGNIIGSIENSSLISGISSNIKFMDLMNNLNTSYKTPVIGTIKINNEKLAIDNLAILNKNKIKYLDNKYNLGYNFLTNNIDQAIINYKCDNNKYSSVKISNSNTVIKPKIIDDLPFINIYISGDIYILEDNCNNENIENNTNKEIKNIISNALEYSKNEINIDIFNINELFYKYKYNYYKNNNFNDLYSKIDYKIITKLVRR